MPGRQTTRHCIASFVAVALVMTSCGSTSQLEVASEPVPETVLFADELEGVELTQVQIVGLNTYDDTLPAAFVERALADFNASGNEWNDPVLEVGIVGGEPTYGDVSVIWDLAVSATTTDGAVVGAEYQVLDSSDAFVDGELIDRGMAYLCAELGDCPPDLDPSVITYEPKTEVTQTRQLFR